MALPATRTVTGKYVSPVTGRARAGSVVFSPHPTIWTDKDGNQLMLGQTEIDLDDNGEFSQSVVRTDAPDVFPASDKLWRFTERIDGSPARTVYFEVNAGSGPIDVTDLIATIPGNIVPGTVAGGDLTGTYPDPQLANTSTARSNLGLGNSATRDVGTTSGTVTAGDDSRVVNAVNRTGDTMTGSLQIVENGFDVNVARELSIASSTGIVYTTGPLTQASATSVNVPAGVAVFTNHTAAEQGFTSVEYGPTVVELDDPNDPLTYFMVDDTGAVVQNDGVPTRAQRRQFAILGRAVVLSGSITDVQDSPILATHPVSFIQDLVLALGNIRVDGMFAAAIAGTLTFSLTSGNIFNLGAGYQADPDDPNVSPFNAVSPVQLRYVTRNQVFPTLRTAVDPTQYDNGGVLTAVGGGSGTATIQRVHCFPTQNVFIQYGQSTFSSLANALDALAIGATPGFVTHPDLHNGGVRTAFLVMTRTATNLADTATARVTRATVLGEPGGVT